MREIKASQKGMAQALFGQLISVYGTGCHFEFADAMLDMYLVFIWVCGMYGKKANSLHCKKALEKTA